MERRGGVSAVLVAVGALVMLSPPASADDADDYMGMLDRNGVEYDSRDLAVSFGQSLCNSLRTGAPVGAVLNRASLDKSRMDGSVILTAAVGYLCADQLYKIEQWNAQGGAR